MALFSRTALLEWTGDVARGSGGISAGSGAFSVAATFPRLSGEPAGATTPEELLAASHATCFGIGLRSVLAQRGGTASQVRVTATVTADKGSGRIRIQAAHLDGVVHGLAGVDAAALDEIARAAEEACTISAVLRATVPVTVRVRAE
ncbi:MAG TPA: OsmC family peroxiredoxin [Longimicrobium sp.]|nr:OsmC family peroxiredoxin [Longimicrobium sp.]